eukprot:scaffold58799_cov63-Phaeocystis_antarctica.AAC.1
MQSPNCKLLRKCVADEKALRVPAADQVNRGEPEGGNECAHRGRPEENAGGRCDRYIQIRLCGTQHRGTV